jgi:hypothetical protein
MKAKIIVTTMRRTGTLHLGDKMDLNDVGELKKKVDIYLLEPGMEIFKFNAGQEFKVDTIEAEKISIVCSANFSEVSKRTGGIDLFSAQKKFTLNIGEDKEVTQAVTDGVSSWNFKLEEIIK